jgi:hypothetical protein
MDEEYTGWASYPQNPGVISEAALLLPVNAGKQKWGLQSREVKQVISR